jgi:hypothetical protein
VSRRKTDVDRIKNSIQQLRERWQVEDREFNAATVRAFRFDKLSAEIFKFFLAPTTSNESKTLNLLIVEEAHLADGVKRSNELDPVLASTGGVTWMVGVGCTRMCDYKRGCDGEWHLEYEKAFQRELRKKGRQNPEIRRNYYLEYTVEEGNFVARERLLSCARGRDIIVSTDRLLAGIDWAQEIDYTWLTIVNNQNDVIDWFKYPMACPAAN